MSPVSLPDEVRDACAWVAAQAQAVRIEEAAIENYAREIESSGETDGDEQPQALGPGPHANRESRAAFAVCLNAINFGSGWWPTIRKRPGHSGFFTVAAGLSERFCEHGPWPAAELTGLGAAELAAVLGQDSGHPLMAQFAAALRDVGEHLEAEYGGSFTAAVDSARGSAPALAGLLAAWEAFADISEYGERQVPFFKRAQLAAADLARAGVAELRELDQLTAFADNLVPHVLRVDGVLTLDPGLTARIEAGDLLVHGSPEEVELRACAVHAVELLAAARAASGAPPLTAAEVDSALWNRGHGRRYKALPRPRSRNTAY
ncbi:MAG TPA: queuosine salvage family protein [Solirubrobacterales bacterium]|nr:queuosine salvage family protein [Solirubrobacterales bacterium]